MNTVIRRALAATTLAAGFALVAVSAEAQNSGPRWRAFVGCWTASVPGQTIVDFRQAPVLCVSPTANADAVELATLGETKVFARDTIDASGAEHVFTTKNCTGSQSARWSADERRIYLKSTSTCDGLKSTTSAILALTASGDWLDVRSVNAGEGSNVRVARYRAVMMPNGMLDSIPGGSSLTPSAPARIAAGAPVGVAAIMEASKNADESVVESWILERGQQFSIDANMLVSLADAGVPTKVTDAIIAISNPNAFKLARRDRDDDDVRGQRIYGGTMTPVYCDSYSRLYDSYDCRYSNNYGYGYNRYGYGYGYNNGYNGGGFYGPPVIIISGPGGTVAQPKGQAVKGRGYTQQGGTTGTSSTQARDKSSTSSTSSSSPSSSSSGSSSSASPASGSSSNTSSSSSGRTAHGKP